jgi:hypothetical protein
MASTGTAGNTSLLGNSQNARAADDADHLCGAAARPGSSYIRAHSWSDSSSEPILSKCPGSGLGCALYLEKKNEEEKIVQTMALAMAAK